VPSHDRSNGLTVFPAEAEVAPLRTTTASLRLRLGAPATAAPRRAAPAGPAVRAARSPDRLAALVGSGTLTPSLVVLALLIAFGLGAFHALSPGHGKALVAAWLVGARGTMRHAVLLGVVVTLTHTAGVFALGGVTLGLSRWIMPDRVLPWLELASGLLVVAIGAGMAVQRWRGAGHPSARAPVTLEGARFSVASDRPALVRLDDHGHDHHHHGLFGGAHGHSHAPPPGPISLRSLVALGVSGGLVPCPSALVVLLSAIAFNRVGLGLGLILAFSLGLASVLSVVGVLVVRGARLLERVRGFERWGRWLPAASALLVTVLGVALSVKAVASLGLFVTAP